MVWSLRYPITCTYTYMHSHSHRKSRVGFSLHRPKVRRTRGTAKASRYGGERRVLSEAAQHTTPTQARQGKSLNRAIPSFDVLYTLASRRYVDTVSCHNTRRCVRSTCGKVPLPAVTTKLPWGLFVKIILKRVWNCAVMLPRWLF